MWINPRDVMNRLCRAGFVGQSGRRRSLQCVDRPHFMRPVNASELCHPPAPRAESYLRICNNPPGVEYLVKS